MKEIFVSRNLLKYIDLVNKRMTHFEKFKHQFLKTFWNLRILSGFYLNEYIEMEAPELSTEATIFYTNDVTNWK